MVDLAKETGRAAAWLAVAAALGGGAERGPKKKEVELGTPVVMIATVVGVALAVWDQLTRLVFETARNKLPVSVGTR